MDYQKEKSVSVFFLLKKEKVELNFITAKRFLLGGTCNRIATWRTAVNEKKQFVQFLSITLAQRATRTPAIVGT